MNFGALVEGLSSLGLGELQRIVGGRQSLAVYRARVDGRLVAVKVCDSELVDRGMLDVRLEALSRLRRTDDVVCAPVPVDGRLVNGVRAAPTRLAYAVAYEFAEGDAPDIDLPGHAVQMGRVLADVHGAMAALGPVDLPALAAFPPLADLRRVTEDLGVPRERLAASPVGPRQLLHGDFSSKNVRIAGARWRVFDLDDCGYGPIELDLANSVYFVLFDALTGSGRDRYRSFRDNFLAGYRDRTGVVPSDTVLDSLITRRVLVLASWLADPDTAPPGVRTASDEWRSVLEGFVEDYVGTLEQS